MCGRFTPVSVQEMRRVAQEIENNAKHRQLQLPLASVDDARQLNTPSNASRAEQLQLGTGADALPLRDVFPTDLAPVVAMGHTRMGIALLKWGFEQPWHNGPLFNARMEKASVAGSVWNEAFRHRRCIVVARAFFERSDYETQPSPKTGRPVKRVYRFAEANEQHPLFIAGLYQQGRFTMLTCEPNAQVAPVHKRMPFVLDAAECAPWLAGARPATSAQPLTPLPCDMLQ